MGYPAKKHGQSQLLFFLKMQPYTFFQSDKYGITNIVVEGEPGSGKTTFMKAVCRAWVTAVQNKEQETSTQVKVQIHDEDKDRNIEADKDERNSKNTEEDQESFDMKTYFILLAFVLRQITTEDTMFEMIYNQFNLTVTEAYAIIKYTEEHPSTTCLFFDGFDELIPGFFKQNMGQNQIYNIITRKEEQSILSITTTRYLGMLKNYAKSTRAHVKLCGFSKKQIMTYISLYFKHRPGKDSLMVKYIQEHDLWKLASIPIRLQIMCFVWKTLGKLGKNVAELFKMLLLGLLDHMEQRDGIARTPEEDVMDKYHTTILFPASKVANTWDEHGNLKILLSIPDIKKKTGKNHEDVMKLGCLTRYFAASQMTKTFWNFTHLSLQEYLVAYYIAHAETGSDDFSNKCLSMRSLEKYRTILEFLCSMAPENSNKILTTIINQDYSERECIQLLDYVFIFMAAYNSVSKVDIPLPRQVILGQEMDIHKDTQKEKVLNDNMLYSSHLFDGDGKKHRNMSLLKVYELTRLPENTDINYVKGLYLNIRHQSELEKANILVSQLSNEANIIDISFPDFSIKVSEMEELVRRIGTNTISMCCIKGPGTIALGATVLQYQPTLAVLNINDTSIDEPIRHTTDINHIKTMCDKANETQHLVELKLSGYLPNICAETLKKDIKVTLCSKYDMLHLNQFCKDIASHKPNISYLDLSGSIFVSENTKFESPGTCIGNILTTLETLETLKLRRCGITSFTLSEIQKQIASSKKQVSLQELDLLGNQLDQFNNIQELLNTCPHLTVLLITGIGNCKMPEKRHKLKAIVVTGTETNHAVLQLTDSIHNVDKLYLIYATADFAEVVKRGKIYQMKVLQIMEVSEKDIDEAISVFSANLQFMNQLEELYITTAKPTPIKNIDSILSLIKNLPSSLLYLNLCGYEIEKLTQLLQEKQSLQNLQTLNIGSHNTDPYIIQILRQELQQMNSKMEVYCDQEEALLQLLSYSSVNPPSEINMPTIKDARNLLKALSEE